MAADFTSEEATDLRDDMADDMACSPSYFTSFPPA